MLVQIVDKGRGATHADSLSLLKSFGFKWHLTNETKDVDGRYIVPSISEIFPKYFFLLQGPQNAVSHYFEIVYTFGRPVRNLSFVPSLTKVETGKSSSLPVPSYINVSFNQLLKKGLCDSHQFRDLVEYNFRIVNLIVKNKDLAVIDVWRDDSLTREISMIATIPPVPKYIAFTKNESLDLAEFIYSYDSDVLISSDVERALVVLVAHELISKRMIPSEINETTAHLIYSTICSKISRDQIDDIMYLFTNGNFNKF